MSVSVKSALLFTAIYEVMVPQVMSTYPYSRKKNERKFFSAPANFKCFKGTVLAHSHKIATSFAKKTLSQDLVISLCFVHPLELQPAYKNTFRALEIHCPFLNVQL